MCSPLDMSSQSEVRRLAHDVLETYPRLDVLVNNVGGFWAHRHTTSDGLEHTFALNHLAPFLLTSLLLERLKASAPSRVITVSSGSQSAGRIDFDDLQGVRTYSGQRAYSQSKLANIAFTNELSRRLQGTGVTANAVHPDVVRTNFGSEDQAGFFLPIGPIGAPFPQDAGAGCSDRDPSGLVAQRGEHHRCVLCQLQADDRTEACRRCERHREAVAGQRRSRRTGVDFLSGATRVGCGR